MANEVILIKNGELTLKGLNRGTFEDVLIKNLRWRVKPRGAFTFRKAQSTIYIEPQSDDPDWDEVSERVSKVFGISAYSRALVVEKNIDVIREAAVPYLQKVLRRAKTF